MLVENRDFLCPTAQYRYSTRLLYGGLVRISPKTFRTKKTRMVAWKKFDSMERDRRIDGRTDSHAALQPSTA